MRYHRFPASAYATQRGAVLFVALVFLLLITLLGLTASGTSILEQRMSGGQRNAQLGLMGAETAASGAQAWLLSVPGAVNCGYNGGQVTYNGASGTFCYKTQTTAGAGGNTVLVRNPLVDRFRTAATWLPLAGSGGVAYATPLNVASVGNAKLDQQPQFMVEDLGIMLPPGVSNNGQSGGAGRQPSGGKEPGIPKLYNYRITARSTGGNSASVRAVEVQFGVGVQSN